MFDRRSLCFLFFHATDTYYALNFKSVAVFMWFRKWFVCVFSFCPCNRTNHPDAYETKRERVSWNAIAMIREKRILFQWKGHFLIVMFMTCVAFLRKSFSLPLHLRPNVDRNFMTLRSHFYPLITIFFLPSTITSSMKIQLNNKHKKPFYFYYFNICVCVCGCKSSFCQHLENSHAISIWNSMNLKNYLPYQNWTGKSGFFFL